MNGTAPMSPAAAGLLLLALLVVWVIVVVDILRQPRMGRAARIAWLVGCTLVWPTQVLYLLARPQRGRVEQEVGRTDPHAQLVHAVLEREAGRLAGAAWQQRRDALRRGPGGASSPGQML